METTYQHHTCIPYMRYYCFWGREICETAPEMSDSGLELRMSPCVLNSSGHLSLERPFYVISKERLLLSNFGTYTSLVALYR